MLWGEVGEEMTDLIKRDDATDAAMKAACDWVNGDTANPDEGVSFAIQAAITALPAVTVVNAPEYLCTFPQCGCVAKGQWCPVPCTAIRKAALLDAGYDTPAIDPAAIREAALREAYEVVYKWWFDDGNALPQELILALIKGETK